MKRLLAGLLSGLLLGTVFAVPATAAGENPAPTVLPAIREWQGGSGRFVAEERITLVNPNDSPAVEKVQGYFHDMLSMEAEIVASGESGVIFQKDDSLLETVGEEGYTLDATETKILIKAATDVGLLYGGITVCQSLYADGYFPVGQAVDYPSYPIRSGMIDVGRAWIPLEYVEEISRYMVWFKMNEIHLHINDEGSNGYSAFRLESDVKGLTAKDGYYSKEDYRAYQKRMLEYGMSVVTEIDTPFHSRCYQNADNPPPHLPGNDRCLDISKPETLEFVKNLLAEYMTGDDPVFVGKVVHIGTDEYPREYAEDMRKYTDALIKYVDSLGYIPRHWGSMGPNGFPGETPVAQIGQVNFWDWGISGPSETMASNYDVINTVNSILYTVPTTNYNFPDYFDLPYMYNTWQVNVFNYFNDAKVDPNDPQLKGACFALWNDLHTAYKGVTRYDIFDRLRGMVCMVAEKTWLGVETKNIPADDFMKRYETLSLLAGDADPGRHTYPAEGIDLTYEDGFVLDGKSSLSMEIPALGFPNTLEFEISLEELPDGPLFAGDGVEILSDADGKGHFGFKNEVYTFTYDYTLPIGEKVKLRLSCDGTTTVLTVNDSLCFEPNNARNPNDTKLSTLTIPLETIGKGVKGKLYSLRVTPAYESVAHLVAGRNLALNAPVSVSKLEVDDGRFTADLAVDGDESTRLSFSAKEDEQWLLVDLGAVCDISRVEICYNERVGEYDLQVSDDGENFTTVYNLTGGEERKQETDVIQLENVSGRYIRYRQHKRWYHAEWNTYYSGGIREFRVFSVGLTAYEEVIEQAYTMLEELDGADPRRSAIRKAVNALKAYITSGKTVYIGNADLLSQAVTEAMNAELPVDPPSDESEDVSQEESLPEASTPAPAPAPAPASKGFPWGWVAGGILALGAVAVAAILFSKKKSGKVSEKS